MSTVVQCFFKKNGITAHSFINFAKKSICFPSLSNLTQNRTYAARKGTREKARRNKVKVEVKKVSFLSPNLREKSTKGKKLGSRRLRDDMKPVSTDNVWIGRYYQWRVYDFQEAVQCHRETHHPEIYNMPNASLTAFIELDMRGAKKNKYIDPFSRLAKIPFMFNEDVNRVILAFCKTKELKEEAAAAGATLVGDVDLIKKVEKGEIMLPDFDYILAHPNILPELVSLKGLLKKKFPSPKQGTLGADIGGLVKAFRTGIQYMALRDESEQDYGWIETAFGTLNMEKEELEANFKSLLEDIMTMRPKREGSFITRAMLKSHPSVERLKINLDTFLKGEYRKDAYDSDSDEEEATSLKKNS